MGKLSTESRRVTVRLPETLLREIEWVASERYASSLSEAIRAMLVDAVERRKEGKDAG